MLRQRASSTFGSDVEEEEAMGVEEELKIVDFEKR